MRCMCWYLSIIVVKRYLPNSLNVMNKEGENAAGITTGWTNRGRQERSNGGNRSDHHDIRIYKKNPIELLIRVTPVFENINCND